jgi:hypothetical protein
VPKNGWTAPITVLAWSEFDSMDLQEAVKLKSQLVFGDCPVAVAGRGRCWLSHRARLLQVQVLTTGRANIGASDDGELIKNRPDWKFRLRVVASTRNAYEHLAEESRRGADLILTSIELPEEWGSRFLFAPGMGNMDSGSNRPRIGW